MATAPGKVVKRLDLLWHGVGGPVLLLFIKSKGGSRRKGKNGHVFPSLSSSPCHTWLPVPGGCSWFLGRIFQSDGNAKLKEMSSWGLERGKKKDPEWSLITRPGLPCVGGPSRGNNYLEGIGAGTRNTLKLGAGLQRTKCP